MRSTSRARCDGAGLWRVAGPRWLWALMGLGFVASAQGCGYQFVGRAMQDAPMAVVVRSEAHQPGLALQARRSLEAGASRQSLRLVEPGHPDAADTLDIVVVSASSAPAGIVRVERDEADAVAATSYQAEVVLEACWTSPTGEPTRKRVTGTANYADVLLPVATEGERDAAMNRALGQASQTIIEWVVSRRLGVGAAASEDTSP